MTSVKFYVFTVTTILVKQKFSFLDSDDIQKCVCPSWLYDATKVPIHYRFNKHFHPDINSLANPRYILF